MTEGNRENEMRVARPTTSQKLKTKNRKTEDAGQGKAKWRGIKNMLYQSFMTAAVGKSQEATCHARRSKAKIVKMLT